MKKYKRLTDSEVEFYQKQLILPNEEYPYYTPLIINGINVQECLDINPIDEIELFKKTIISDDLLISNYGRVLYKNKIIELYVSGIFLHCTNFCINEIGSFNVYRIVKETFDPVEDMKNLQVHHINNNALDNRPENLIWVTKEDHKRIDKEFNYKLIQCSKNIRKKIKNMLIEYFNNYDTKSIRGFRIIQRFPNVSPNIIRDTLESLENEKIIINITKDDPIDDRMIKDFAKLMNSKEYKRNTIINNSIYVINKPNVV